MTLPTTFDPAYDAVYEALTSETGRTRALGADRLFRKLSTRRADADNEAAAIRHGRAVLVVLRDLAPHVGGEMQPSNRLAYDGLLEVWRIYHAGNDLFSSEVERARKIAATDLHLVRAALCWPGALSTTLDGTATGIDGGALTASGMRSTGPVHVSGRGFIQWTDVYPITITLSAE